MSKFICEWCKKSDDAYPSAKRRFCSRKCKEAWQSSKPELASRWKGLDGATASIHRWVNKMKGGRPSKCEECGKNPGKAKDGRSKIHWSNISGKYKRDLKDWRALCISCHWKYDRPWEHRDRNSKGRFLPV